MHREVPQGSALVIMKHGLEAERRSTRPQEVSYALHMALNMQLMPVALVTASYLHCQLKVVGFVLILGGTKGLGSELRRRNHLPDHCCVSTKHERSSFYFGTKPTDSPSIVDIRGFSK